MIRGLLPVQSTVGAARDLRRTDAPEACFPEGTSRLVSDSHDEVARRSRRGKYQVARPVFPRRAPAVTRENQSAERAPEVEPRAGLRRYGAVVVSEAESLFGQEHVRRYRQTNGAVGHIWKRGSKTLLLTTFGRRTGKPTTTPLIYEEKGDNYVVVASQGGAPKHPGWYRNLVKTPEVEVQVKGDVFRAVARIASGEERESSGSSLRSSGPTMTSTGRGQSGRSRWSYSSAT